MDHRLSRRAVLSALLSSPFAVTQLHAEPSLDTVPLFPDDSHSLYRVRMMLDVEGNAEVPKNELVTEETRKLALKSSSTIDYEEDLTRDDDSIPMAANRYYYEATTKGKVHANEKESGLRTEARRGVLRLDGTRAVLFGKNTQLTNDELELLRLPVNSLAIDRLLPYKSLKIGETWDIPNDVLATLFDMDAIQKSNVSGKLTFFDTAAAKMEITGNLEASIEGVPTSIRLRGKMTFDRKQRGVSWLAIALREDRDIGKAEPGFEVAAQIRIIRKAMGKPYALKNAKPIDLQSDPAGNDLLIDVHNQRGGFSVFCDRKWRVMSAGERFTMLRMIENDNVVAQCDVRAMPALEDGHQLTLEAFQQDIQRTIGERFTEFVEAEEKLTGNGVRLLRVVAQGTVQDIPVQWIYQHFSNDAGRRTAAIFTVADKQLETFGGSDVQFAEGFRFETLPDNQDTETQKPTDTQSLSKTESPEAESTDVAKVADKPETEKPEAQVAEESTGLELKSSLR